MREAPGLVGESCWWLLFSLQTVCERDHRMVASLLSSELAAGGRSRLATLRGCAEKANSLEQGSSMC